MRAYNFNKIKTIKMHMKNQFYYTFLIDVFIVITLTDALSNRLLKVVINHIIVSYFALFLMLSLRNHVITYFCFISIIL